MLKIVRADKLSEGASIREIAKEKFEKAIASGKFMEIEFNMQIQIHLPKIREIREDLIYAKMY